MSHRRTLVFDLDGTLVDTAPDLVSALNSILETEGLKTLPLERATGMIGAGVRVLLERGLEAVDGVRSAKEVDRLFDAFLAYYTDHIADQSRPFPGAIEAADRFLADGWQLAVCTNKLERFSTLLLDKLGIADRFAVIGGGDSFSTKKPDPRHLLDTIAAAGGDPTEAVMVGDSETDIVTAKNANVPVVAVDFGYAGAPVAEFSPDRIISHFDELYDAVMALSRS